jgi:hypothetical protein
MVVDTTNTTKCQGDHHFFDEEMIVDSSFEPKTTDTSQESPPAMTQGGMIVDFPCEPRMRPRRVSSASTFVRPVVQISQFSCAITIPYDDPESKWYSKEEENYFKQAMLSDVSMLRDFIRDATPALISEEILYECLGSENLLSSYTADLVFKKRREHSKAVLSVQMNYKGDDMVEMIGKTSRKSSRWARKRAFTLASAFASREGSI